MANIATFRANIDSSKIGDTFTIQVPDGVDAQGNDKFRDVVIQLKHRDNVSEFGAMRLGASSIDVSEKNGQEAVAAYMAFFSSVLPDHAEFQKLAHAITDAGLKGEQIGELIEAIMPALFEEGPTNGSSGSETPRSSGLTTSEGGSSSTPAGTPSASVSPGGLVTTEPAMPNPLAAQLAEMRAGMVTVDEAKPQLEQEFAERQRQRAAALARKEATGA